MTERNDLPLSVQCEEWKSRCLDCEKKLGELYAKAHAGAVELRTLQERNRELEARLAELYARLNASEATAKLQADEKKAALEIALDTLRATMLDDHPDHWNVKDCAQCQRVSVFLGRPFGCERSHEPPP